MSGKKQGLIRGKDRQRVIRALVRRDGLVCYFCKGPLTMWADPNTYERISVHHIIERSEGGGNKLPNLALAHRGCDNSAGGRSTRPGIGDLLDPHNPHLDHPDPTPQAIEAAARTSLMLKPPETIEDARDFARGLLNSASKTGWYPKPEEEE